MKLSCLKHVKRESSTRPPAPNLYTDVGFVGDASGSMVSMGQAPKKGADLFIRDQIKSANKTESKFHVEFTTFATTATTRFSGDPRDISAEKIQDCVSGMLPTTLTKFYDSLIAAIKRQQTRVNNFYDSCTKETKQMIDENPWLIALVITTITDGMDNKSIGDAAATKRAVTNHRENFGATIIFLGANFNAENFAATIGIAAEYSLQVGCDESHAEEAFRGVSVATMRASSQPTSDTMPLISRCLRQASCDPMEASTYNVKIPQTIA